MLRHAPLLVAFVLFSACTSSPDHDLILRNGTIVDGIGAPGYLGDLAIDGDRITAVGDLGDLRGVTEVDVSGLAVAPGFINMLSWAGDALMEDGRSQGDIRQGVTLEVFGEGGSGGPLTDQMKNLVVTSQGDIKFDVEWTTLGEYLEHLEAKGVSPNVASFVGATTMGVAATDPAHLRPLLNATNDSDGLGALAEGLPYALVSVVAAPANPDKSPGVGGQHARRVSAMVNHSVASYIRELGYQAVVCPADADAIGPAAGLPRRSKTFIGDVVLTDVPVALGVPVVIPLGRGD